MSSKYHTLLDLSLPSFPHPHSQNVLDRCDMPYPILDVQEVGSSTGRLAATKLNAPIETIEVA